MTNKIYLNYKIIKNHKIIYNKEDIKDFLII